MMCLSTMRIHSLLYYTNGSHEGFVKFCVIEVFKFWVRSRWMNDEDINTIVTPTAPATIHTGPITRARARQLNYQLLSFLGNDSNVHENMMLP